jgi:hypothetical protein
LVMISKTDMQSAAQDLSLYGIPLPGDSALRWQSLGPFCANDGSTFSPTRRAFLMLRLLGSEAEADVRFKAVDIAWKGQALAWFERDGLDPALVALNDPLQKLWVMLAALRKLSGRPAGADAAALDEKFAASVDRLCPGMPNNAWAAGPLATALDDVKAAIRSGLHPVPLPYDTPPRLDFPIDKSVDEAVKAYFGRLSSSSRYGRSREWTGKAFAEALKQWFRATLTFNARLAAHATLSCLGGDRLLEWRWLGGEFVDVAQNWVIRQIDGATGTQRAMYQKHVAELDHVELVVAGMAWLAGIHPGAPATADIPAAAITAAREGAWLSRARQRVNDIVKTRFAVNIASPLLVYHYQPEGVGRFTATGPQWAALAAAKNRGDENKLYARYFLRLIHRQLALVPLASRHTSSKNGLYERIKEVLTEIAAAPATSSLHVDTAPLLAGLLPLWLCGGTQFIDAGTRLYSSSFDPHDLSPLPPLADMQAQLGGHLPMLAATHRAAMITVALITDAVCAVTGGRSFDYRYLEGRLRSTVKDAVFTAHPDLDQVRLAHQSLFNEFAEGNLFERIKAGLALLGLAPRAAT